MPVRDSALRLLVRMSLPVLIDQQDDTGIRRYRRYNLVRVSMPDTGTVTLATSATTGITSAGSNHSTNDTTAYGTSLTSTSIGAVAAPS
jgi:hypothetical protein